RGSVDCARSAGACADGAKAPSSLSRRPMAEKRSKQKDTSANDNVGSVIEIKGVVIDAVFPGELPQIYNALRLSLPEQDGREAIELIAEVQQHLGDDRVRAVAMDTTDGIPRGVDIVDTGAPISVPVGKPTLGRIFNVLGEPIDTDEPVEAGERWPIHRDPPGFEALQPPT